MEAIRRLSPGHSAQPDDHIESKAEAAVDGGRTPRAGAQPGGSGAAAEKRPWQMGQMLTMWVDLLRMEKGAPDGLKDQLAKQRVRVEGIVRDGYNRLQQQPLRALNAEGRRQLHRMQQGMTKELRRALTGAEDKRIRDFIREKRAEPPVARWLDQVSFTVGVLAIVFSQFVLLQSPQFFWMWYLMLMTVMLALRVVDYHHLKWQYFLFDFCYFANFCCFAQALFAPRSCLFTKINFVFSHGPLLCAVLAWRNSLVFHDVDKMTTVYIHIAPAWLLFTLRWFGHRSLPQTSGFYATLRTVASAIFTARPPSSPGPTAAAAAAATSGSVSWLVRVLETFSSVAAATVWALTWAHAALCRFVVALLGLLPAAARASPAVQAAATALCGSGSCAAAAGAGLNRANIVSDISQGAQWFVTSTGSMLRPGLAAIGAQESDTSVESFLCSEADMALSLRDFGLIVGLYILWQVLYFVKTEIIDAPLLDADPSIPTSLRWISADVKHPMNRLFTFLMRKLGIMRRDELFDAKTLKTKIIFMGGQLLYTIVTMAPAPLLLSHFGANTVTLVAIFAVAVYNAGGFYMQVFARRYETNLEKKFKAAVAKTNGAADADAEGAGKGGLTLHGMDTQLELQEAPEAEVPPPSRPAAAAPGAAGGAAAAPADEDEDDFRSVAANGDGAGMHEIEDFEDFEEFRSAIVGALDTLEDADSMWDMRADGKA